jgi:hypothetical protein
MRAVSGAVRPRLALTFWNGETILKLKEIFFRLTKAADNAIVMGW